MTNTQDLYDQAEAAADHAVARSGRHGDNAVGYHSGYTSGHEAGYRLALQHVAQAAEQAAAQAEAIGRATGSRAATVTHEHRDAEGRLVTDARGTWNPLMSGHDRPKAADVWREAPTIGKVAFVVALAWVALNATIVIGMTVEWLR